MTEKMFITAVTATPDLRRLRVDGH
jgi:hypothetical protein